MNIHLTRICASDKGTFGALSDDNGLPICLTCELPWGDNEPDKSCIPAGQYQVMPFQSPTKGQVWELVGVPGRAAILIHAGNDENDSEGCILVGNQFGVIYGLPGVFNSQKTLNLLRAEWPASFNLIITDPN